MKRFTVLCVLFALALTATLLGACSVRNTTIGSITDVTAADVRVGYDGLPHCITVNARDSDTVSYSVDSHVWQNDNFFFTDPGEYCIFFKVERQSCSAFFSFATLTITIEFASNIYADDATFVYDGAPHSVPLIGVTPEDRVLYSLDGVSFSPDLELCEVGVYTVFYRVFRDGGVFYADSCAVTILPDLSGVYYNLNTALAVVGDSATLNGVPVALSYDVHGNGVVNDLPFSLSDSGLIVNNAALSRLHSDAALFCVFFGTDRLYLSALAPITLNLSLFSDYVVLDVDGVSRTYNNVNYCENPEFSDGRIVLHPSSDFVEFELLLSLRQAAPFSVSDATVMYDGLPHAPDFSDLPNSIVFPQYSQPGVYDYEFTVYSDVYLPFLVSVTLTILPDYSGTYFSASDILIISHQSVLLNSLPIRLDSLDFSNGIAYNGVVFSQLSPSQTLLAVNFADSVRYIAVCSDANLVISPADASVRFVSDNSVIADLFLGFDVCGLDYNGERLARDETGAFVIAASELEPLTLASLLLYRDYSGVYFSDTVVVEIDGFDVRINDVVSELSDLDFSNGIAYNGTQLSPLGSRILLDVRLDAVPLGFFPVPVADLIVAYDSLSLSIALADGSILFVIDSFAAVASAVFDGQALLDLGGCFIITAYDLPSAPDRALLSLGSVYG